MENPPAAESVIREEEKAAISIQDSRSVAEWKWLCDERYRF